MRARLAIVAVLLLAGCGGADAPLQRACTEIGCGLDAVEVETHGIPSGNVEIALCVENRKCVRRHRSEPLLRLGAPIPKRGERVRVTMIVSRDGRELARATTRLPRQDLAAERAGLPAALPLRPRALRRADEHARGSGLTQAAGRGAKSSAPMRSRSSAGTRQATSASMFSATDRS